jgi:hypothetical protein
MWGRCRRPHRTVILYLAYGSQFDVTYSTNGSADIVQASLVRPCAATHSVDMDQRLTELDIISTDAATGTMALQAPTDGTVAPPEAYMLFRTHALGAISVGSWLLMSDTAGTLNTNLDSRDADMNL